MADWNVNRTQSITVTDGFIHGYVRLDYPAGYTFSINVADTIRVFDWGGPYNWVGRYVEDFEDVLAGRIESSPVIAELQHYMCRRSGFELQSDVKYGGSNALRLVPGGMFDILYVSDAGSTQVTAYCYYELGASARMEIRKADGSDELVTYDEPSGDEETWEQLTCSFTAEKGFYIVRFINKGWNETEGSSAIVVFDNIE